ncbi:MAG: hypothetical protein ACJ71O_13540 [Nitrososphaeraceae archaeon]
MIVTIRIQHKKCEVAAVLQVKRLAPPTGVQLSIPAQQTLLTEVDRYG